MNEDLNMKSASFVNHVSSDKIHKSSFFGKIIKGWIWTDNNPYIVSGGVTCKIEDMSNFIKTILESNEPFIVESTEKCDESVKNYKNILPTKAFLSYGGSNRLWHVGGAGTFRSSLIMDRHRMKGCVVLGNSPGIKEVNIHHIAKMMFSDLKAKKLVL